MKKVFSYIGEDLKTISALRNTCRAYKHLFSSKMIGFRRDYYRKLTRKSDLLSVCDSGNVRLMRELLKCHRSLKVNVPKGRQNRTPLIQACFKGHTEIVKLLLSVPGIDVNCKVNGNYTALYYAACNGSKSIVKLLMKHQKLDVDCRDNFGKTPLFYAAKNGHTSVVKLLLQHPRLSNQENFMRYYQTSKPEIMHLLENHLPTQMLVFSGKMAGSRTDEYARDQSGVVGNARLVKHDLWGAVDEGNARLVKDLLKCHKSIEVNALDGCQKRTPLIQACFKGDKKIVKLLLSVPGIDVNLKSFTNHTALYYAACNGSKSIVKLLMKDRKLDVNCRDNSGKTPLFYTACNGSKSIVKLLMKHQKLDADCRDNFGKTPLFYAAKNGHTGVVKLLLQHPRLSNQENSMRYYQTSKPEIMHLLENHLPSQTLIRV